LRQTIKTSQEHAKGSIDQQDRAILREQSTLTLRTVKHTTALPV